MLPSLVHCAVVFKLRLRLCYTKYHDYDWYTMRVWNWKFPFPHERLLFTVLFTVQWYQQQSGNTATYFEHISKYTSVLYCTYWEPSPLPGLAGWCTCPLWWAWSETLPGRNASLAPPSCGPRPDNSNNNNEKHRHHKTPALHYTLWYYMKQVRTHRLPMLTVTKDNGNIRVTVTKANGKKKG